LIPQGTRLIGLYDHQVIYGQERVLVTWKRVLFSNGASLSLKDGMPGTDPTAAAGFHDEVNLHLVRIFGNALLLTVFSAGVQLSQIPDFGRGFAGPSAGNVLGAALGQQLGQTSNELIRRGINIAPTLEVRPGYAFKGRAPDELHRALTAYDVWALVVQMFQRFVETDHEFQGWRRRTQNGPGGGPTKIYEWDRLEKTERSREMVRQDKASLHTVRKSSSRQGKS
jgi:type IV secretory pathway VirB10-like protein